MNGAIYVGSHEPTVLDDERESDRLEQEADQRALDSLDSLQSFARLKSAKPSRAASASDWAANAEEALADIRADLDRGLVMQLPIAKLKSAVERLELAMREAENAQA